MRAWAQWHEANKISKAVNSHLVRPDFPSRWQRLRKRLRGKESDEDTPKEVEQDTGNLNEVSFRFVPSSANGETTLTALDDRIIGSPLSVPLEFSAQFLCGDGRFCH